jgi:hypothetical protein
MTNSDDSFILRKPFRFYWRNPLKNLLRSCPSQGSPCSQLNCTTYRATFHEHLASFFLFFFTSLYLKWNALPTLVHKETLEGTFFGFSFAKGPSCVRSHSTCHVGKKMGFSPYRWWNEEHLVPVCGVCGKSYASLALASSDTFQMGVGEVKETSNVVTAVS